MERFLIGSMTTGPILHLVADKEEEMVFYNDVHEKYAPDDYYLSETVYGFEVDYDPELCNDFVNDERYDFEVPF